MKRIGALLISLAALVPASAAVAVPDDPLVAISSPFVALRSADRIGNPTPADDAEPVPPLPEPTPPTPEPSPPSVSVEMQAVLDLVNDERTERGLAPLEFSANLNDAAMGHTLDQAAAGDTFHLNPVSGIGPGERMVEAGYLFSRWGENVAAGFPTAASVMQGWMNSPGHCRNILNPAFTDLGVGFTDGGVRYNFFWTMSFARPKGVDRPAGEYDPAWC